MHMKFSELSYILYRAGTKIMAMTESWITQCKEEKPLIWSNVLLHLAYLCMVDSPVNQLAENSQKTRTNGLEYMEDVYMQIIFNTHKPWLSTIYESVHVCRWCLNLGSFSIQWKVTMYGIYCSLSLLNPHM